MHTHYKHIYLSIHTHIGREGEISVFIEFLFDSTDRDSRTEGLAPAESQKHLEA